MHKLPSIFIFLL